MLNSCYACKSPLVLPAGIVGIGAACERCQADVRVCRNCKFFDLASYNECREPQAERVLDKERRNRCDFFALRDSADLNQAGGNQAAEATNAKNEAKKKLEELFK